MEDFHQHLCFYCIIITLLLCNIIIILNIVNNVLKLSKCERTHSNIRHYYINIWLVNPSARSSVPFFFRSFMYLYIYTLMALCLHTYLWYVNDEMRNISCSIAVHKVPIFLFFFCKWFVASIWKLSTEKWQKVCVFVHI